jgi:hypothetical protein
MPVSGSSGNAYIGWGKSFTEAKTGSNHKVSFEITIPATQEIDYFITKFLLYVKDKYLAEL